jgi:hypothetical protein
VALTGLGDGRLLILERSGCPGLPPFENRMYTVDTTDATDVTASDGALAEHPENHAPKTLLWQDQLGCNLEGLCLGPSLGGERRALLAIADNNGIGTPNLVVGFTLEEEVGGMPLSMVAGAAALAVASAGLALHQLTR